MKQGGGEGERRTVVHARVRVRESYRVQLGDECVEGERRVCVCACVGVFLLRKI